jgi:hypothetical protein
VLKSDLTWRIVRRCESLYQILNFEALVPCFFQPPYTKLRVPYEL